ncbi:MAG: crossover junction endodeoxyribonuclease RuvC [Clostridia bacterium]|nr:crossover junction endodeoxyribonuclease RuvC [Clostridia bacterium]
MVILGIDPGVAIVGYGVVDYTGNRFRTIDYGAITTPAKTKLTSRIKTIYEELRLLLYRHKPDVMAVEELFFNTNTTTAMAVAQARGVILLAGTNESIPIFEYTPLQIKQAVTGYGRADKQQMQQMTKTLLGLASVPKPDDTADALAVAICHGHSNGFGSILGAENI